ncbi:DUF2891 domain-containing protein [Actinokineospora sp. NBRC 105648]|uniref:DUF2891 domain-containing protein n=1 Tax=Actinokineospora sp. NBRC 105648 TaxID=3032206 RepID=UPI0024A0A485|nr:DUF2891 domain-containing protein [Actinokineospora sp. NBRC 105648]GLZ38607.1 hypothetical protein Acsp05_22310 [Actinokineospora sp. NBRC 105648]
MTSGLGPDTGARLLRTAVANIQRDYPVHWIHLIDSPDELVPQRARHPVFAGSFDWHSCVHQTWLAARLLRLHPAVEGAGAARAALDQLITPEGAQVEAEFFAGPEGAFWERPYGWAWLLLLDAELRAWPPGAPWADALRPLVKAVRGRWLTWLGLARWPVRVGTHTNSAFALSLGLDAARAVGDSDLITACEAAARRFYLSDRDYGGFEPSAADFLSPALAEADLLRRVLPADEFASWLDGFFPDLLAPRWNVLREPIAVDDPADPHGSHLAGLALSRTWGWRGIAEALPADHRYVPVAHAAADLHHVAGWQYVFGHGYAAEHWLGTFAAYLEVGALDDHSPHEVG